MNGPSGNRDLGNLFPSVDNDDGSAYFRIAQNVVAYGGFKNYLGHDKVRNALISKIGLLVYVVWSLFPRPLKLFVMRVYARVCVDDNG